MATTEAKNYVHCFECIKELPESGYCFLENDDFSFTRQELIQQKLFSMGYSWDNVISSKTESKIWDHGYSIIWRIDANGKRDLSWAYDETVKWENSERSLEKLLFEDYFAPKKTHEGFVAGLTYGI